MKRLAQWLASLFGWEKKIQPAPSAAVLKSLRLEHERRMEAFDRALAAAIQLRDLLALQTEELQAKDTRLRARLQAMVEAGDERAGAQLAVGLKDAAGELDDARRRLSKACEDVEQLTRLREEAIAKAQAQFQEASDLAGRAVETYRAERDTRP